MELRNSLLTGGDEGEGEKNVCLFKALTINQGVKILEGRAGRKIFNKPWERVLPGLQ